MRYKYILRNQKVRKKKSKKIFLSLFCAISCVFFISYTAFQSSARQHPADQTTLLDAADAMEDKDPEFDLSSVPMEEEMGEKLVTGIVKDGENLVNFLGDWLSSKEIHDLTRKIKPVYDLRKIRAGQEYKITLINNTFARFEYVASKTHYLEVDFNEGNFTAAYKPYTFETEVSTIHGTIKTNLCDAIGTGNLSLAVRLANILGWEIDFTRDLREGDRFAVIVEKRYSGGEFQGYGNILAAEFIVQGKRHDAYRFKNADGSHEFYSSDGKGFGHFFIKTPVAFTRISSGFSLSRFHPITKTYKPHYGVDYAAPTGTPIYALGAGTLTQVEHNRASGKFIRINHGSGYETAYLHMSNFARGMRAGKRVSQGELIGYVGQTGYATGPHLCFRMKKNGKPVDPTRIDMPRAKELPRAEKAKFLAQVENLRPKLSPDYQLAKTETPRQKTGESVN